MATSRTITTTSGMLADIISQQRGYTPQQYYGGQYQQQIAGATQQANYDISSAYTNYLNQQMMLNRNNNLFAGYKQQTGDYLTSQYQGAYTQAQNTMVNSISSATQEYQKNVEAMQAQDTASAKKLQNYAGKLQEYFENYYGSLTEDKATKKESKELRKLVRGVTGKGKKDVISWSDIEDYMYDVNPEAGTKTLNEAGKQIYGALLAGDSGNAFDKWLLENASQQEYDEWKDAYATQFGDIFTGDASLLSYGDGTISNLEQAFESIRQQKLKDIASKGYTDKKGNKYSISGGGEYRGSDYDWKSKNFDVPSKIFEDYKLKGSQISTYESMWKNPEDAYMQFARLDTESKEDIIKLFEKDTHKRYGRSLASDKTQFKSWLTEQASNFKEYKTNIAELNKISTKYLRAGDTFTLDSDYKFVWDGKKWRYYK